MQNRENREYILSSATPGSVDEHLSDYSPPESLIASKMPHAVDFGLHYPRFPKDLNQEMQRLSPMTIKTIAAVAVTNKSPI